MLVDANPPLRPVTSAVRRSAGAADPISISVAAFRSGETTRLSRQLGFEVAVVAAVEDPAAHAQALSRRWHGALRARGVGSLPWDAWDAGPATTAFEVFEMDVRWLGGAPLPAGMSILGGSLRVALPPGSAAGGFAAALSAAMQDLTFENIARRPGQVAYRYRTGRQLEFGARYAGDPPLTRKPDVVDDLYFFRPRSMRSLVGRVHQAATLVGVRSALRLASARSSDRQA